MPAKVIIHINTFISSTGGQQIALVRIVQMSTNYHPPQIAMVSYEQGQQAHRGKAGKHVRQAAFNLFHHGDPDN